MVAPSLTSEEVSDYLKRASNYFPEFGIAVEQIAARHCEAMSGVLRRYDRDQAPRRSPAL